MTKVINCPITGLNKKKRIYKIFDIPAFAQDDNYDFSMNYEFKFIDKKKGENEERSNKLERISKYLKIDKEETVLLDSIPPNRKESEFRKVLAIKKDAQWLKKAQRKFHKKIAKGLTDVDYLHSTIKTHSYATNGIEHVDGVSMFKLDLKDFFTQIDIKRVKDNIIQILNIDPDVADFYSKLLTAPLSDKENKLVLGQGLPSSPILAFIVNRSLFDYLYEISCENNIKFTVYVDDICFSSAKEINQKFINRLFGLFKSNHLKINKGKVVFYKPEQTKQITGVYLKGGKPKIAFKKHEEIFTLYKAIINLIHKSCTNIDDYFELYNLFIKFSGNVNHLFQVEYKGDMNTEPDNFTHMKYLQLNKELIKFFKPGLPKIKSNKSYSSTNVYKSDIDSCEYYLKKFQDAQDKIIQKFPRIIQKDIRIK